jgi:hypothetical protein
MKYIKNFSLFEAVIMPNKIDSDFQIRSIEDAIDYGRQNDFDVVGYDEFYNSLTEADKRNAPPRRGVPFFALFHPERKRPMFVACDPMVFRFMPMKEIIDDIIGHELVHAEQSRRKGDIDYSLPSPTDRKAYFSNKEEVMAFSWTIANELSKQTRNVKDAIDLLSRGFRGQSSDIWSDIKKNCDEKTINRYKKYIYMYLEKMFDGEEVKPGRNPFKELDRVKDKEVESDLDYREDFKSMSN